MKHVIGVLMLSAVALSASAKNVYIPVAGVARGLNNTFFRTDVRIFNPSITEDITLTIYFLPQEAGGTSAPGKEVTIPRRGMAVLNDIVGTFFAMPEPTIGSIRLDSGSKPSYEFIADSRIYTDSPNPSAPGTYGQFISPIEFSLARARTVVLHVANVVEYRTNAGVMNPGTESATVTAILYATDGSRLGASAPFVIVPKSMRQFSVIELFGNVNFVDGYIEFQSTQPVFTWGSLIDNRSGDPIYIPGVEDKATAN